MYRKCFWILRSGIRRILSTKFETRNPKQIRNSNLIINKQKTVSRRGAGTQGKDKSRFIDPSAALRVTYGQFMVAIVKECVKLIIGKNKE